MEENKSISVNNSQGQQSQASSYQVRGPLKYLKENEAKKEKNSQYKHHNNHDTDAFQYMYKMEKQKDNKAYSSDSESLEIGSHSRKDFKKNESDNSSELFSEDSE